MKQIVEWKPEDLNESAFRSILPRVLDIPYNIVRKREPGAMTTATITSKGQITIPVAVREALKVEAGDRIEFVEVEPGRFEFFAATRSVKELKGMFGKATRRVSIEEMNEVIATQGAAAK